MNGLRPRTRPICVGLFVVGIAFVSALHESPPRPAVAAEPTARPAGPYSDEASDLWNRIHRRFHVRTEEEVAAGGEATTSEADELDPLLWPGPWDRYEARDTYLLKGTAHRDAVRLLDEFLANGQDDREPARRALMQHDLWAVFDWLASPAWSRYEGDSHLNERRALYLRLARVIERLVIDDEAIDELPDTYAASLATGRYPSRFDPAHPERPFLPPDLWDPAGPWVSFAEWAGGPLASRHVSYFDGRSAFVVFMNLPEGREATIAYLDTLRKWRHDGEQGDPPQPPKRTQVALARRMLLVGESGKIVPTPVTEMIQIRVLRDPESTASSAQSFVEFRLRRGVLLAGRGAALEAVGEGETDRVASIFLGNSDDRMQILESCRECHLRGGEPGILSVRTFSGGADSTRRVRKLLDAPPKREVDATIDWKRRRFSWGLLTGLREAE